ncbi:MAG: ATP synthase subunit I [Thioalkalivibrionaceae bacterium]
MASDGKILAVQALLIQAAVTVALAAALLMISSTVGASVLVGGAIASLGHGVVTWIAYRPYRADQPEAISARLMVAEGVRLMVVGAAFAATFATWRTASVLWLIASFLLVHLIPAWWIHRRSS